MHPNSIKLSFLVFCVAAGMSYDINFGVRIPVGELLAFASLPFLIQVNWVERYGSRLFAAVAVLAVWVLGVCLSDFINQIPLNYFLKGLAKPIWCGLWMLFFIGILSRDYRALYAYPAGSLIAGLQNYFFPQAWTEYFANAGEYEAATFALLPLIMAVILCLSLYSYRKFPLLSALVYFLGAIALAFCGVPRSTIAMTLLIFLVLAYMWSLKIRRIQLRKVPVGRVVLMLLIFSGASYAIFEVYVWAASNGWMGELQQKKLEVQSSTIFGNSLLGLILGGRTHVFAAILAIMDRPFIGFGSWQSNFLYEYYFEALEIIGANNKEFFSPGLSGGAGHSILFSAWLENGLLAALSMAVIGYWMFKELLNVVFRNNPFAPLLISMGLFFFWSYLFSPFGVESRLIIGLFLTLRITQFCKYPPKIYPSRQVTYPSVHAHSFRNSRQL